MEVLSIIYGLLFVVGLLRDVMIMLAARISARYGNMLALIACLAFPRRPWSAKWTGWGKSLQQLIACYACYAVYVEGFRIFKSEFKNDPDFDFALNVMMLPFVFEFVMLCALFLTDWLTRKQHEKTE